MKWKLLVSTLILAITLLLEGFTPARATAKDAVINPTVEKALLNEDWEQVSTLLGGVDPAAKSPELRLIKGHALLALNESNGSIALFASTLDDESRQRWQAWADSFAARHPYNAVAWYFKGDAYARSQKWNAAAEALDRAIKIDSKSYLALNARGVVAHAVGSTIKSRVYFLKSTKAKHDFADAYASRGTLNVYGNSVKADSAYQNAKKYAKDKNPTLVTVGLGCASYGKQDYVAARDYFEEVLDSSYLSSLALRNSFAAELARLTLALSKSEELGTSIQQIEFRDDRGQLVGMFAHKSRIPDDLPEGWVGVIDTGEGIYIGTLTPLGPTPKEGNEGGDTGTQNLAALVPTIVASTTGPGKRGGRGGGVTRPPSWNPPVQPGKGQPPPSPPSGQPKPGDNRQSPVVNQDELQVIFNQDQLQVIIDATEKVTESINQQVTQGDFVSATPMTTEGITQPGGADSNPTNTRINRGKWPVRNVYGLLYSIPEATSREPTPGVAAATPG